MRFFLFIFLLGIFITSCKKKSISTDEVSIIENIMRDYRKAWINGDSAKVVNYLSNDMTLFMPNKTGKPIKGKKLISEFWFPKSDLNYPILSYKVYNSEIKHSGNLAYYQGISKLHWCTEENGVKRDTVLSISEFTNILIKKDNSWKIHRIMYNSKDKNYNK